MINCFYRKFFLLTILLLNCKTNCKNKKGTKHGKRTDSFDENKSIPVPKADTVRPSDISRELFCDVCQAIIIEALKNLRNLYKESDVIFYLTSGICLQKNFENYHFSKPEMEIGCEIFIGEYNDEIQRLLIERNPKVDDENKLIEKFCVNKINACNGVDLSKIKPIEAEIVNGELYDIEYEEKTYRVTPKIEEVDYDLYDDKESKNESELL